jgi:hypothetical protein
MCALVGPQMKIEMHYLSHDALRAQNPGKFRVVISKLNSPLASPNYREGTEVIS